MNRLLKSIAGLLVLANVGILSAGADEIPLPDDYMQLEWIRSTPGGQQYINTGYKPLASDVVTCVVDVENVQASGCSFACVFGSKLNNMKYSFAFFTHMDGSTGNNPSYDRGGIENGRNDGHFYGGAGSFTCGQRTTLVCDTKSARWWTVDSSVTNTTSTVDLALNDCRNDMFIFTENTASSAGGLSSPGSTYNTMKLYSFSIAHADGTKVRDFIPCRNASGKCGLWDKVTGVFYPNANTSGTQDFLGPDNIDVFVSYINSTRGGQQYLNTKYMAKANDVVTCVVDVENVQTSSSTWAAIFGSKVNNGLYSYAFFTHDANNGSYNNKNPHYERGQTNVPYQGIKGTFTCGQRTTLVCDSHTARWWADGSLVTN